MGDSSLTVRKLVTARPPDLTNKEVRDLLVREFSCCFVEVYENSVRQYPGFEDRNYFFVGLKDDGTEMECLLKISDPMSVREDELKAINRVMIYLAPLQVSLSYPIQASNGELVVRLLGHRLASEGHQSEKYWMMDEEGTESQLCYCARVLLFVPGKSLSKVESHSHSLLYSVGENLGNMDAALKVSVTATTVIYTHSLQPSRFIKLNHGGHTPC